MKKLLLLGLLLLPSVHAWSWEVIGDGLLNPFVTHDTISSIITTIEGLRHIGDDPEVGAELNVIEEMVGALMDGDESYRENEGSGKPAPELELSVYTYLFDKNGENKANIYEHSVYSELNKEMASAKDMEEVVKKVFFMESGSEADQHELLLRRNRYLTQIARAYVKEAYNVQQKIISDMDVVGAKIDGNGSIGSTSGADQTWKAVNKALISDIALQIQLMELDAAKFLSVQPMELMTEKRPEGSNQGANSNDKGGNS